MDRSNLTRVQTVDKNGKVTHVHKALSKAQAAKARKARIDANIHTPGKLSLADWLVFQRRDKKFKKFESVLPLLRHTLPSDRIRAKKSAVEALDKVSHHWKANVTSEEKYLVDGQSILADYPEREFALGGFGMSELRSYLDWYGYGSEQALFFRSGVNEVDASATVLFDTALHRVATGDISNPDPRSFLVLAQSHPFFKGIAEGDYINFSVSEIAAIAKEHEASFRSNHEVFKAIENSTRYNRSPLLNSFSSDSWNSYQIWNMKYSMEQAGAKDPQSDAIRWMAWLYNEVQLDSGKWHTSVNNGRGDKYKYVTETKSKNWTDDYLSFSYKFAQNIPFDVFKKFESAGIRDTSFIDKAYRDGYRTPNRMLDYLRVGLTDYKYIKNAIDNGIDAELAKSLEGR